MRVAVALALSTVATAPVESPDLTRVPPNAAIVDSQGATWTRPDPDNLVTRDGVAKHWGGCHALKYVSGRVWFWDSGGWQRISVNGQTLDGGQAAEPGGEVPPTPPGNHDPSWNMADVIFEQGVAAQIDLRTRATDLDGDALTFNVVTAMRANLVGPFTFNDFILFYDGRDLGLVENAPPLLLDSGITIAADDGRV